MQDPLEATATVSTRQDLHLDLDIAALKRPLSMPSNGIGAEETQGKVGSASADRSHLAIQETRVVVSVVKTQV